MPLRRFLFALLTSLVACGDDVQPGQPDASDPVDAAPDADTQPRQIALQFAPHVGGAAFACGQSYPSLGAEATTITPRDFRLYVHDVMLIGANGSRVPLVLDQDQTWQYQNVALLDFENFTGGCMDGTPETNTTLRGTVPAGSYTGVAFTVGVPETLNHKNLVDLPAPLNLTGLFWGWNFGHLFLAIASHTEITTPTPGTNDHYVHIGSIDCVGDAAMGDTIECGRPNRMQVELPGFDPTTTPIVADYGAVLAKSKLTTSAGCHSFTAEPCAWPFDYVGLNWFTGSQTPTTQKLFRIAP